MKPHIYKQNGRWMVRWHTFPEFGVVSDRMGRYLAKQNGEQRREYWARVLELWDKILSMTSEYHKQEKLLLQRRCDKCFGLGELNDGDLGDTYFNEWQCSDCKGTGFKPNTHVAQRLSK